MNPRFLRTLSITTFQTTLFLNFEILKIALVIIFSGSSAIPFMIFFQDICLAMKRVFFRIWLSKDQLWITY